MNIVVIGTGLYVSGNGSDDYGTVLPALIERQRNKIVKDKIYLVGTNKKNTIKAKKKYKELSIKSTVNLNIQFYPKSSIQDNLCYKDVINKITGSTCAIIAVPDHLHYKIARDCLLLGIHCLIVKPFTTKVNDALDLTRIANQKKILGYVEFHKRLDKSNRTAKTQILNKKIGDINYITVDYSQRKEIPLVKFKKWSAKTNIFNYLGVHYVDIVYFLTGAIPKRVMAVGQKNYLKKHKLNTYDSIQSLIEWESKNKTKFIQSINVNWIDSKSSTAMSDQKMKIIGTCGRIELDQKNRGISLASDEIQYSHINPDFNQSFMKEDEVFKWEGYGIDNITSFLDNLDDYLNKKISYNTAKLIGPSFDDSLVSVKVSEAVMLSLKSKNSWIIVK